MQPKVFCPICWEKMKKQKLRFNKRHKYFYVCDNCHYAIRCRENIIVRIVKWIKRKI